MTPPWLALDIGTRKVAGLVAEPQGRGLRVWAARIIEHPDRAMQDGQVHHIEAVAEVVRQVKQELEKETGLTFTSAAVAAAGRALVTKSAVGRRQYPFMTEITRDHLRDLELTAARAALASVQTGQGRSQLHCVGYSPVSWTLDGERLDALTGHMGRETSLEILATFLPRTVVDSLLAVLRRADLQAATLTLEPMAAIEATIPPDLRRMNLALVDIGAGTSDIAITREGSVVAYAMVTEAGDEITEALGEHYLLEFPEAERVKKRLEPAGTGLVEMTTLLGKSLQVSGAELMTTLQPAVARLAGAIAERIVALNQGVPKAVVLVGGGSATPGLGTELARVLGLDPARVGMRGPDTIPELEDATGVLKGIEAVTPLGIVLSAVRGRGLNFFNVRVNGREAQLLALHETSTVFDALVSAGHEIKSLVARPGRALTYTVEGKLQVARGTQGKAAEIRVNGKPAHLDTPLTQGDDLSVTPAEDGEDAKLLLENIEKPAGPVWCSINDRHQDLELVLMDRGRLVAPGESLEDRAALTWVSNRPLEELCPDLAAAEKELAFQVRLNGEVRRLDEKRLILTANGKPVDLSYRPGPDDRIVWKPSGVSPRVLDLVGSRALAARMNVKVNGAIRTLDYGGSRILVNGQPARLEDVLPEQAEVQVETHSEEAPILSQVLEGLPLVPPQGGTLKLTVDGQPAGFTTPLHEGADIQVSFT